MAEYRGVERRRAGRKTRLMAGGGVGAGAGVVLGVVVAGLYKDITGNPMDPPYAAGVAGLLGAWAATVSICIREIKEIIYALIDRRR